MRTVLRFVVVLGLIPCSIPSTTNASTAPPPSLVEAIRDARDDVFPTLVHLRNAMADDAGTPFLHSRSG